MKNPFKAMIPIQLAFSVGAMRVLAISMFDHDDEDDEDGGNDTEGVVASAGARIGFALEPVDELDARLEPLEDD